MVYHYWCVGENAVCNDDGAGAKLGLTSFDEEGSSTAGPLATSQEQQHNIATSMASVAAAAAASRHWYRSNKNAEMIPFLSLCSRYPGGPWAGLLQQTIKDKQKGKFSITTSTVITYL